MYGIYKDVTIYRDCLIEIYGKKNRNKVLEWMSWASKGFHFENYVFCTAVYYLYLFIRNNRTIPFQSLEKYTVMCLVIAWKILENDLGEYLHLEDVVVVCKNKYTMKELCLAEKKIFYDISFVPFIRLPFSEIQEEKDMISAFLVSGKFIGLNCEQIINKINMEYSERLDNDEDSNAEIDYSSDDCFIENVGLVESETETRDCVVL
jgi:hypothetical protein